MEVNGKLGGCVAIAADQSGENQDNFFGRLASPNEPLCAAQPCQQTQVNVIESIASATTAYTARFRLEGEETLSDVFGVQDRIDLAPFHLKPKLSGQIAQTACSNWCSPSKVNGNSGVGDASVGTHSEAPSGIR